MSDSTLEQADSSNKLRGKASVKTFSFDEQLLTSEKLFNDWQEFS